MATSFQIGSFTVTALSDGESYLPPLFYPGLDFDAHPGMLHPDGTHHIPTGCFLIQGKGLTVLVDAGTGPNAIAFPETLAAAAGLNAAPPSIATGGTLPEALAAAGVTPEDVSTVFLTHLHADHVGWVAPAGKPFFPNAEVVYGAADWDALIASAPTEDPAKIVMEGARAAGVLRSVDAPVVEIGPGITGHHTPGHTPGHYIVRISDGGQEAYLLGDAVHHPLQLNDPNISFLSDADAEGALKTREELLARLTDSDSVIGMDHFPDLHFQRITLGAKGRTWTNA